MNNITDNIKSKIGKNLYKIQNHPICIIKNKIFDTFNDFEKIEIEDPFVSTKANFDDLLIPTSHVSRNVTDTFYKDDSIVLRTHMTAYLSEMIRSKDKYVICGDVYRRDEIDSTHFPVFHQIDGFAKSSNPKEELRDKIKDLIVDLFGNSVKYKILEDYENENVYFPFTINSFEIEVEYAGKNIEILGAGTVHPDIVRNSGNEFNGYAFGLGLERLAMLFFDIPDIRYFWTDDERFTSQFKENQITKFKPYSKYEVCYKDIAFYINDSFNYNDFCAIVYQEDKDSIIESVKLIDNFYNKKINKISNCYRINYRSMNRTLTNDEINDIQTKIRERVNLELNVILR